MKRTWFANGQGCGWITGAKDAVKAEPVAVELLGKNIDPGQFTDMNAHFGRPLEYLGTLGGTEMIFYIGEVDDMFMPLHYFQSVWRIGSSRIFESFAPMSGRDFHFIGGVWK